MARIGARMGLESILGVVLDNYSRNSEGASRGAKSAGCNACVSGVNNS